MYIMCRFRDPACFKFEVLKRGQRSNFYVYDFCVYVCTIFLVWSITSYWNKILWWYQDERSRSEMELKGQIAVQSSNHSFILY